MLLQFLISDYTSLVVVVRLIYEVTISLCDIGFLPFSLWFILFSLPLALSLASPRSSADHSSDPPYVSVSSILNDTEKNQMNKWFSDTYSLTSANGIYFKCQTQWHHYLRRRMFYIARPCIYSTSVSPYQMSPACFHNLWVISLLDVMLSEFRGHTWAFSLILVCLVSLPGGSRSLLWLVIYHKTHREQNSRA